MRQPPNQQLERTVIRHRGDAASAPFHYALASRFRRGGARPLNCTLAPMAAPRRFLGYFLGVLGFVGLASLGMVGVRSLGPSESARAGFTYRVSFPELQMDASVFVKLSDRHGAIIIRPSVDSLSRLDQLDMHVSDPRRAPYDPAVGLLAFLALPPSEPCSLVHVPRGAALARNKPSWPGGFFMPCGEISFDYSGRAIRSREFAIYGRGVSGANLPALKLEPGMPGELIVVSQYGR